MPSFPPDAPSSPELQSQSKHILKDPDMTKITRAQGSWKPEMDNQRAVRKGNFCLCISGSGAGWVLPPPIHHTLPAAPPLGTAPA